MNIHDIKMMEITKRFAIDNEGVRDRFKLSSIIAFKRDIISIGNNRMKTHPLQKKYGKNDKSIYLHAEIDAISNALNHISKSDLKNCTMYIYRVKKDSNKTKWVDGISCPCSGCFSALSAFGLNRIIFSTDKINCFEEHYL